MHQDASSSILTTSRSIQTASSLMRIKRFVLYIDPPALRLTWISDGVVRAKIQQLGQQAKLKGLPPRTQPQAATAQASTSAESEATGETATPEEIARNKA